MCEASQVYYRRFLLGILCIRMHIISNLVCTFGLIGDLFEISEMWLQITPFRFVGSTAMMKRLRTASSPYLHPLNASHTDLMNANGEVEPSDKIAAIGLEKLKAKGNLLPLLPIPAKPGVHHSWRTDLTLRC